MNYGYCAILVIFIYSTFRTSSFIPKLKQILKIHLNKNCIFMLIIYWVNKRQHQHLVITYFNVDDMICSIWVFSHLSWFWPSNREWILNFFTRVHTIIHGPCVTYIIKWISIMNHEVKKGNCNWDKYELIRRLYDHTLTLAHYNCSINRLFNEFQQKKHAIIRWSLTLTFHVMYGICKNLWVKFYCINKDVMPNMNKLVII